jgi:SOS-response transcriptional repressor LexA
MVAPRVLPTFEECWEKDMTKVQREVFLIVDEYWKKFGYSPSLRDIAYQRGKTSLANTMKIVDRLVDLGVLKKQKGSGRTIRPVYINFRTLE